MKKILNLLVATALILSPVHSLSAQPKDSQPKSRQGETSNQKAEDIEIKFQNVMYSLANIEDIVKDLAETDRVAGAGISPKIAEEIHNRFAAAVQLVSALLLDSKLNKDKRDNYLRELCSELGQLLFTVIRHQGEDKINIEQITTVGIAGSVLREYLLDVKSLVTVKQTGLKGEWVWSPIERGRRDALSQEIIGDLQQMAHQAVAKMDANDPFKSKSQKFWVERVVAPAIKIRDMRLTAQRAAALTYLGFAFWGLMAPMVDTVGLIDGRSENSLFVSSIMYASVWFTIASIKAASISGKTVQMLKDLMAMLRDPKYKAQEEKLDEGAKGFSSRFLDSIQKGWGNMCSRILSFRKN